ncbi:Uma2 family endonuclease [Thermoflexibacter ruber]|uniref:Endonuclease, Uma2 family (Restriction endonuclease fold) n=1 Tax=Thermoflexibacter ruber TaxID=1003 RepID=A0A1I2AJK0_9BACT|nr:Uma2 family endonuclease [Thermoflexibacter ruber]SFE43113.1 Endonuclease, Uma2 family (restriction endonuclease fold) [Thermoflexibacter ruber]
MILTKTYTLEDYALFCERMNDFGLFEYVDGLIVPVQSMKAVDDSLIDYVLSKDFEEKEITTIFEMPTQKHDRIVTNLYGNLFIITKRLGLIIYSQATTVAIPELNRGRNPDIILISEKEEKRNKLHQILNPLAIFEVLSKSTQAKDKSDKLTEYQQIESLQAYIIISQFEVQINVFQRLAKNKWEQEILNNLEDTFTLKFINTEIKLKDIYEGVVFEQTNEETKA